MMKFKGRYRHMLLTSCVATTMIVAFAAESLAQSAIEEITVTARKREESLQEIPLSITAITAGEIEKKGVADIRDIVNLTPGLSMSEFGAGTLNFPVIRGLTNLTGGQFAENNVSVFYNNVYLLNSNIVDTTFLDIERVEVIKGPVSALYGRNAYSGVINYVTKRPSDQFEGSAKAVAGSDGRYGAQGSISGPVVDGKLGFRLGARADYFGGTWEDPVSGVDFGGYKKKAAQAGFEFDPTDSVNALLNLYYSEDKFDLPARALTLGNCGGAAGAFQTAFCGKLPDIDDTTQSRIRSTQPSFEQTGNDRDLFMASGDISFDIGAVTLRSISSYMDANRLENRDQDGTGSGVVFNLVGVPAGTANLTTFTYSKQADEAFTQELRLSNSEEQQLRWSFGAFYSKFKGTREQSLTVDQRGVPAGRTPLVLFPIGVGDPVSPPFIQRTALEDRDYSGFGVIEYDPSERLTVSAEARWTNQRKFQNQTGTFLRTPAVDPDGANGLAEKWKFWSFRFTADYDLGDGSKVYASAAKGNKAGGFNAGVIVPADLRYNPEVNWTYELGYKANLLDDRIAFDASVFYADLSGLQLFGFVTGGIGSAIRNGGDGKTTGFETNVTGSIADGVTISGGLAYSNPTFKTGAFLNSSGDVGICRNVAACTGRIVTDSAGRVGINLAGLSLPRQSDWQGTLSMDVVQPLTGDWNWTLRGNYRFESKQYMTTPLTNVGFVGSKHIANVRAGVETDQYAISAYVDNLFNDGTPFNFGSGLNAANVTFPLSIAYGDKRTFGIEARVNF